jgi:hypothetical protein
MKGWFLYNCAHKNSSIKSSDGQAWIRVLGYFSTKNAALEHAKSISTLDGGQEIRIAPSGEFRLMLKDKYNDQVGVLDMETRERETAKHEYLLRTHLHRRKEAFAETMKNAEERQMGKLEYNVQDRLKEISTSATSQISAEKSKAPEVGKIPKDYEIRMQKFAALAFIPDYEAMDKSKTELDQWENECEEDFIKKRNLLLIEALKSKQLPNTRDLMSKWVAKNPPPKGVNVFGQEIANEDIWGKGGAKKNDSEVFAWCATFKRTQEQLIWESCGLPKPEREEAIQKWLESNPLPQCGTAEPAVSFLFASNTEQELRAWIDKECTVKQHDIACVSMYEWIKVANVWGDKVKKTFREPLVSKLYEKREFQNAEAKRLEGLVKEIVISNESS